MSETNRRKDYEDDYDIYQDDLGVPYHLLYYPDNEELALFRPTDRVCQAVGPNEGGRLPVPELEVEVGTPAGRLRYWFRGELVKTPAEFW